MSGWVAAILVAISRGLQHIRTLGSAGVRDTHGCDDDACTRQGHSQQVPERWTALPSRGERGGLPCLLALPPTWMQADKSLLLFGALLDEIKALGLAEQSLECVILDAHRSGWDRIPWSAADMAAGEEMRQMCRT